MAAVVSQLDAKTENVQRPIEENLDQNDFTKSLLAFEASVRNLENKKILCANIVNDSRRFLGFRQAFLLLHERTDTSPTVASATSIAIVDRNAPTIRWIEKLVRRLGDDRGFDQQGTFELPGYCSAGDPEVEAYPFRQFLWTPLQDGGHQFGGLLLAREKTWTISDEKLTERLCHLYAHAFQAIRGRAKPAKGHLLTKKRALLTALVLLVCALFPVRISVVAPAQIVAANPVIISAPFSGVISEILIDQGKSAAPGDPLVRLDDTERRSAYEIAVEAETVARARYLRVSQSAIVDENDRHDIAITKAELALAKAEREHANRMLKQSVLAAPSGGIVVYTDRRDLEGQPIHAGEQILQIANPSALKFSIDLPVKDVLVVKKGARVKVFPDSSPLKPFEAEIEEISFEPRLDQRNILSYRISAILKESDRPLPRIGIQGTAKLEGEQVPLIYSVLRRPLSMLRQWTGW